jgi:hypothetical protein
MTARWTTDAEIIRNRVGTLPEPMRHDKRRFTLGQSLAVMALMLAAFAVGVWW